MSKVKLEKLDALRGFAAAYVVLHHAIPHHVEICGVDFGFLFRFGQEAVILFFLLSGFVINYSFEMGADKTLKTYLLKRACRIYIPLLCVMLLGWVIECLRLNDFANFRFNEFVLNLMMLQDSANVVPNAIATPYMGNLPLWSLSYEWWFYMMYYPLKKYLAVSRQRDLVVYVLSLSASVVYIYEPEFFPRLVMYMGIWWTGVFMSNLYISNKQFNVTQIGIPLCFLFFLSLSNGIAVYRAIQDGSYQSLGIHPVLELRHFLFALMVVCLAMAWKSMRWKGFDVFFHPFLKIAPISFGLYISHFYFVVNASFLDFIGNPFIEQISYLVLMVAFAYSIERLIFPWGQRLVLNWSRPVEARITPIRR